MRALQICVIILSLLLISASFPDKITFRTLEISNSQNSQGIANESINTIPFDQLTLNYSFTIKYSGITIPQVTIIVDYSTNEGTIEFNETDYNVSTGSFDFVQHMAFASWLIALVGFSSENVTFLENSSTREIALIQEEGFYIPRYINEFSAYNLTGNNWTPFWVKVNESITNGQTGIYAYNMDVNQTAILLTGSFPIFNESRPVMTFKSNIVLTNVSQFTNISHSIGLVYDNITGILLKGALTSVFTNATSSTTYQLEMSLSETNLFEIISETNPSKSSTNIKVFQLPPPNYLILGFIIIAPLLLVILRVIRIEEIEGGL